MTHIMPRLIKLTTDIIAPSAPLKARQRLDQETGSTEIDRPKPRLQGERSRAYAHRVPTLPQYYYHSNFCEMLDFVKQRYAHCLTNERAEFYSRFHALPKSAQYLYVRMAGRKAFVFNTCHLAYDEIKQIDTQISALKFAGFVSPVQEKDYYHLLIALTKPQLLTLMAQHLPASLYRKSWTKPRLIDIMQAHCPFHEICPKFLCSFIVQRQARHLGFWLYLYFGRIEENLQNFTMRDLGLVKLPDLKSDYGARFDGYEEAESAYYYALALHRIKHGRQNEIDHLAKTQIHWPKPHCTISQSGRDKLFQKFGERAEQQGNIQSALDFYSQSHLPLCAERMIRLRYKRDQDGDRDWVKRRLHQLIDTPLSDENYHFASDFYARKFNGKRTSRVTDLLRESDILYLDEAFRNQPEMAAQRAFKAKGYEAYRSENHLWRSLFGLLFWDELFDPDKASLHNSFERMPSTLKTGTFYTEFKDRIDAKLSALEDGEPCFLKLVKIAGRYYGQRNGIFRWHPNLLDLLRHFLEAACPKALSRILAQIAQNYADMKDGYPDLLLIKDGKIKFCEVKARGDVLRRNQLARLTQLRAAGFNAEIIRIDWIIDPEQVYVVVDVETTGGKPGAHRITEIGAVKVKGGQIIDEWQSLINPQRSIPPKITQLTAIDNEMVANAPIFAQISESFKAFMGEAIFAAHNVNFDYSFISHEFARIGHRFRHPKLCTCASMRRVYPGHNSYSLKNLCKTFNIELNQHHRALHDARAAASLLHLINEKRMDHMKA